MTTASPVADRTTEFRPYSTRPSGATRDEIFVDCNRSMYAGYGPVLGRDPFHPQAYPMLAYVELIRAFAAMEHLEVVTLRDLCLQPDGGDRVRLAIRHDVDGDIVAAREMATIEHRFGLPSSYYMLHTAPYHGLFRAGVFQRHEAIASVYREIESFGHEIGLHTDGLTVYKEYDVDGAQAVAREIEWMRERGLEVTGTVAHGSKAALGAENYEIFAGRRKGRPRDLETAGAPELLEHEGKRAWLRVLDEETLGLVYEGNDIFRQKDVPVEYGATRTVDGWRWNAHRRRRTAAGSPFGPEFCGQDEMLGDIGRLTPGCCVVLTVHPCYFGLRAARDAGPALRFARSEAEVSRELGWTTHRPDRVHGWSGAPDARPWQTIAFANELGMLDVAPALSATRRGADLRILFVDGGNLDGRGAAVPSHTHRVLEGMVIENEGRETACLKLAHDGLGIARLGPWLDAGLRRFRPHVVVLGVTSQELRRSVPEVWSVETGFSRRHPPGDYLDRRGDALAEARRSHRWAIRRRRPRPLTTWPGTDHPIEQVMGIDDRLAMAGGDAREFLVACYRREVERARQRGARCLLLITESGEQAGWSLERAGAGWSDPRQDVLRRHVGAIADRCDARVVDPYPVLAGAAATHHENGAWAPEAHRLAARAIYEALIWGQDDADAVRSTVV